MTRRVACILCSGTDYAADCARGQCHAQQLDLIEGNPLNDPGPLPDCQNDSGNCVQVANWRGFCLTHDERRVDTDMHRTLDPQPFMRPGRHERGWPHDRRMK